MNPNSVDVAAKQRAEKTCAANYRPRYFKLDRLERYVDGTQYEGRPSFWNDDVPLMERGPCIVKPAVETAIRSNVDFVIGAHRWPTITARPGEDDSTFDDRFGLDEEDSEVVDAFIKGIVKQARLKTVFAEGIAAGQSCGTAVAIGSVRNGRLCVDLTLAKWCTPTFDETDPSRVVTLEIRYPYVEEFYDSAQGRRSYRCMLYRRVIDAQRDATYKPTPADENGMEPPLWVEEPAPKTQVHGLGFCPVVWYKSEARCSTVAEIDGRATHAGVLDELDALNFAHSQRHRASLYTGDPQMVETGVDEDHNPAPMGREFTLWVPGGRDHLDNMNWRAQGSGATGKPARKKGPGVVFRYPSPDSKVEYLTLPGDALKNIDDDIKSLEGLIKDALAVVSIDPDEQKIGSDLSGRALEWLYRKQTNHCDTIRDDAEHGFILPVIDMLLRIVHVVGRKRDVQLYLAGVGKALPILQRFEQEVESRGAQWFTLPIELRWPPYFKATDTDQKMSGDNVRADLQAGLITKRTAVEKNAPYYDVADVGAYMEALQQEADEKAERDASLEASVRALQGAAETKPEPEQEPDEQDAVVPPSGSQKATAKPVTAKRPPGQRGVVKGKARPRRAPAQRTAA